MERKLATVLFVDLVDSTGLVAAEDPEVVRRRVTRYFERAARCIEQHGGTVEKFAGDAVMAAFGVPRTHEDDAERGIRAAFAVMDAVHELGLDARIGVEAGEVVVDESDSTFATGEAVNIAARLQQSAAPGEIVLGPGVRRLAAGAVEVEDIGPLEVKGRAAPVWTWRALRALDARRRRPSAPFIGREGDLDLLERTYDRALRDRRAHLVTIFGEPGVGKSRLAAEFAAGVERATVLTGRALPYGEGVAYWPLASMIKASAGIRDDDPASEAFEKLRTCCESDAVADLLAAALGVLGASGDTPAQELSWAALSWAEQLAEAQPLVLIFEDAQWADEKLLELVEHLARSLRRVPALIVTVARTELLDTRPDWGGGNVRSLAIELAPLEAEESSELADALLTEVDIPPAQRALLLEKAEGNPLFLEETARMLTEAEGDGGALERIPDSVQALIAARIDRLAPAEKQLLQRAALIGRVFWRGALDRLSPDLDVAATLDALLEHDFIVTEEGSTIGGERAFRFAHGLIRDVAYSSLSKAQRAEDHRAFADWLGERAPDELVEIRAYHLDQAASLLDELDGAVPPDLASQAAELLEAAAHRAFTREMNRGARRLFLRAAELEPTLSRRLWAALSASRMTELDTAETEYVQLLEESRAAGDGDIEGVALIGLADVLLQRDADTARARELADAAVAKINPEDIRARYYAHSVLTRIGWWTGDFALTRANAEAMTELAERLSPADEALARLDLASVKRQQGEHAEAAAELERAKRVAAGAGSRSPAAFLAVADGSHLLEDGDPEGAEAAYRRAVELFRDAAMSARVVWTINHLADALIAQGDHDGAEEALRSALRIAVPLRERSYRVETERRLAELLLEGGRLDEAERMALAARRTVGAGDIWSRASSAQALARVRERQGRLADAAELLEEATALLEPTDFAGGALDRSIRGRLAALSETDRDAMPAARP